MRNPARQTRPPPACPVALPEAVSQGTAEARPSPLLRRLSSPRESRAAPRPLGAREESGAVRSRRGWRWGAGGCAPEVPAQKAV